VEIDVSFHGPLTYVVRYWASSDFFDGNLKVLLYTRFGHAKSSWPIVGVGREVGPRRNSYAAVVAEWLSICRDNHPVCPRNGDVPLPTRVLDVSRAGVDQIRLRKVSGQGGSYLALSHCWGGKIAMQTTRENLNARKEGIRFGELPETFQDAVTVTRGLGLKYLWIDALCIIQDDQDDWGKESGNMAAIYQNAYVVLGADMSADSHGGFLDVEMAGYHGKGVPIAVVGSEDTTIYARPHESHGNPCPLFNNGPGEPLSSRAWTLQEQLLASRMVHFAKNEMIWECKSALFCECMELDDGSSDENQRISYYDSLASSSADKFKTWYRVVNAIGARNITKPGDVLPALSGLARQFQDSGAGPYLAGLWLDDLPQGLLWIARVKGSRASPYRAPSWSWASIQDEIGKYEFMGGELESEAKLRPVYAKILEAACTPGGKDPLGAVASGYLKVSAPVMEMVHRNSGELVPLDGIIRSCRIYARFDFKFSPDRNETLHCLFVGELTVGASSRPSRGLVLRRRRDVSESTFERVGSFGLDRGAAVEYIQVLKESKVVII
jgi:hypothetical protein